MEPIKRLGLEITVTWTVTRIETSTAASPGAVEKHARANHPTARAHCTHSCLIHKAARRPRNVGLPCRRQYLHDRCLISVQRLNDVSLSRSCVRRPSTDHPARELRSSRSRASGRRVSVHHGLNSSLPNGPLKRANRATGAPQTPSFHPRTRVLNKRHVQKSEEKDDVAPLAPGWWPADSAESSKVREVSKCTKVEHSRKQSGLSVRRRRMAPTGKPKPQMPSLAPGRWPKDSAESSGHRVASWTSWTSK